LDLLGNSEIKSQPIGSQGSGKKIQVVDKKVERAAGCCVGMQKNSSCLAR